MILTPLSYPSALGTPVYPVCAVPSQVQPWAFTPVMVSGVLPVLPTPKEGVQVQRVRPFPLVPDWLFGAGPLGEARLTPEAVTVWSRAAALTETIQKDGETGNSETHTATSESVIIKNTFFC